jgi:hypothetical protein
MTYNHLLDFPSYVFGLPLQLIVTTLTAATAILFPHAQAPEIVEIYGLDVSPAFIRHTIRQKFEANRYVHDVRAIDVMIHKGRVEYQETMNCWKQPDNVLNMLENKSRPQRTFLQKFYEGEWVDGVEERPNHLPFSVFRSFSSPSFVWFCVMDMTEWDFSLF